MIDYRPLQQPVAFRDRLREPWGWMMIVWLAIIAFLLIFAFVTRDSYGGAIRDYWYQLILCVIPLILLIQQYRRSGQTFRLKQFADTNNLTYRDGIEYDGRDGLIFQTGHSKKFHDLVASDRHDVTEFGNFEYVTGHGRSRQTHHRGFARIILDRNLPHIVLDAKSNNFLGRISNLDVGFNKDQRLSLEGDFDKHFSLYAAPQYKTDALYIFTPDVMALMIDKANAYDVEIIDDSLYLYFGKRINLTDPKQLQELFELAGHLRRRVNKQAGNYADERVGPRELNVVGDIGARMDTGLSTQSIIVLIIIGAVIIWNVVFRGILQY